MPTVNYLRVIDCGYDAAIEKAIEMPGQIL